MVRLQEACSVQQFASVPVPVLIGAMVNRTRRHAGVQE